MLLKPLKKLLVSFLRRIPILLLMKLLILDILELLILYLKLLHKFLLVDFANLTEKVISKKHNSFI